MGYLELQSFPVFLPICVVRLENLGFVNEFEMNDYPDGHTWQKHLIRAAHEWYHYAKDLKHKKGISFSCYGEKFSHADEFFLAEQLWQMVLDKKEKVCQ